MPVPLRWISSCRRARPLLAALALAALAVPAAAQQRPGAGTLSATVVDAQSGQGIAGVLVEISPGGRTVATDAEGRFALRLRAGGYVVHVSHLGYAARERAVQVQPGVGEPLVFSMEPEPVVLERLHVTLDRFAARRNTVAMSSRVLDRAHLTRSGGHNLVQVLASAAVPLVPCTGRASLSMLFAGAAGTQCVYTRGEVVPVAVYVDDMPAFGGMDELTLYSPLDAHHVEVYGTGRMIRVYTMEYVEAVATGRRPLRTFADFRCNGC